MMMKIENELKKGNFLIGECTKCKKIIWPLSQYCSNCFEDISWRKASDIGKLIEYSEKNGNIFCLVEFENTIRVIGTLIVKNKQQSHIGQQVKLEKFEFNNGNFNFTVSLINDV